MMNDCVQIDFGSFQQSYVPDGVVKSILCLVIFNPFITHSSVDAAVSLHDTNH
jgi:hypothetical protein